MAPDGRIVWWRDDSGDERGRWLSQPFEGGPAEPLLPGVARRLVGRRLVRRRNRRDRRGDRRRLPAARRDRRWSGRTNSGGAPAAWASDPWNSRRGGVSADGRLVCAHHSEHADIVHRAIRVLDAVDGAVLGDLRDPGRNLDPIAWSPVPGDDRLLFQSDLGAVERPAIWEPRTGERTGSARSTCREAAIPVGMVARRRLDPVRHEFEATFQLYRVTRRAATSTSSPTLAGEITDAAVRPDGSVWFATSDSVNPPRIVDAGGDLVRRGPGRTPAARPPVTVVLVREPPRRSGPSDRVDPTR